LQTNEQTNKILARGSTMIEVGAHLRFFISIYVNFCSNCIFDL